MIQTNIDMLKQVDWKGLMGSLTMKMSSEGNMEGYLNLMVDKSSGKILEIAYRTRLYENMAVSHVKLVDRAGEFPQLELLDERHFLPETVRETVVSSFEKFNKLIAN